MARCDKRMLARGLFPGLLVLLLCTQLLAAPARVQTIRIADAGGKTRVVLDLDQTTDHKLFTLLNPHRVVVDLPVDGKPTPFDLTDQLKTACTVLIEPILEGLRRLIATFDPEFQSKLKERVLLAGGGSMVKGLRTAVEKAMNERLGGGKVIRIEEPIYGGSNGALKIAHDFAEDSWEQLK